MVRVHNQQAQAHTIMVKDEAGKVVTRHIPASGFIELAENRLSQDVFDKNRRGIIRLLPVPVKKLAAPEKTKEKAEKTDTTKSDSPKSDSPKSDTPTTPKYQR